MKRISRNLIRIVSLTALMFIVLPIVAQPLSAQGGVFKWLQPETRSWLQVPNLFRAMTGNGYTAVLATAFSTAPATFQVTNTNDSGAGSLRQAILDANAKPGADIISFNIPESGPHKIQPLSPLPGIINPVLIDGYTQPESQVNSLPAGTNAVIKIQIDGMLMNAGAGDGLVFGTGATTDTDTSTVRGLSITRFRQGIYTLAPRLYVTGNFIGIEPDGLTPQGNDFYGVYVQAPGVIIGTNGDGADEFAERNLLSGNYTANIRIHNTSAAIIAGNLIGTDRTGTLAKPTLTPSRWFNNVPCVSGISMESANGVRIGTNGDGIADAAERNIISGHTNFGGCGVGIGTWLSNNAVVAGNLIGTDVTGLLPIPNWHGVSLSGLSENGRVGTDGNGVGDADERNVIAGNQSVGVHISHTNNGPLVAGNFIGTDITGTRALSNLHGVYATHASYNIRVGGTTPAFRNIISGNGGGYGVWLNNGNHAVLGNYIGTDVTGSQPVPNGSGVSLEGNSIVGNGQPGGGNLISGNSGQGIYLLVNSGNKVQGNLIGTDATGTRKLPNGDSGVFIRGSHNNLIGGSNDAERNVISGNGGPGVRVENYSTGFGTVVPNGNRIEGNLIGTDRGATLLLGNGGNGINIRLAASTYAVGNTIVDNAIGIAVSNGATDSVITSNYIGTTEARGPGFGNRSHGIDIRLRSSRNAIGDGTANGGNVIAYNTGNGVTVADPGFLNDFSKGNLISANSIFNNGQLGIDLSTGSDSGVTANDTQDPDEGANRMQNYPVVPSSSGGPWTLNSTPNTLFRIEFFGNAQPDTSGLGEGKAFLDAVTVTTDANGNATFTPTLAYDPSHTHISATATDPQNNTSEFSSTVQAQAPPPTCSTTVTVPGTSNPYLAGMPVGSIDNGWDSVPHDSPVLVSGIPVTPGAQYNFSATGKVHLGDGNLATPDGFDWYSNAHYESNGIGGYTGPANALLGVFLTDAPPNTTPAPASVNLYTIGFNNLTASPALKQPFFIGDGKTSSGAAQTFIAPPGATRLFLATLDGYGWFNNGGSFEVVVTPQNCQNSSTPPPTITVGPGEGTLVGPGIAGQPGVVHTTFGGTGNAGCTIQATVNDPDHGNVGTYTATVDASGNWSMNFDLHDCDPTIEFVQICNGDASDVVRRHIYVDGTPPVFTGNGPVEDETIYIGGGSSTGTILIDGSASDPNTYHCVGNCGGVTYEWYLIGGGGSRTLLGSGGSGGMLIEYTGGPGSGLRIELGEGEYEFEVVVIDGAGNRIIKRCRRRITRPQPLNITGGLPENGGIYGPGTEGTPGRVRRIITGTGNAGCTINIKVSDSEHPDSTRNNQTYTTTVDGSGNWSMDLELDDCHPVVEVWQSCGGTNGETIRRQIYVDGTPPHFTGGGPADGADYIGSGGTARVILSGAASDEETHVPGAGVTYKWTCVGCGPGGTDIILGGGGSAGILTGGGSGLEIDLQPGTYEIEVEVCDTAGNCIEKRCRRVVYAPLTLTGGLPDSGGIMGPGTGYTVIGGGGHVSTRVTGRGNPGCTVQLKVSDPEHPDNTNNNRTLTTTVDSSGNWAIDLVLDDCHPVIEIVQVCDGESSDVIRRQVYVDSTPPVANLADKDIYVGTGGTAQIVLEPGISDDSHLPGNAFTYEWYIIGAGGRESLCTGCPGTLTLERGVGEYIIELVVRDSAGNETVKRCVRKVLKRPTTIECASNSVDFGGMVTLSATLKDGLTNEVLTGKTITFKIGGLSVNNTFEAWLVPGLHQVEASFNGDAVYEGCTSTGGCPIEVRSTPGKITGGGSIDERLRNFGFVVQTKSQAGQTLYTGSLQFHDKSRNYNLHSETITVIAISPDRLRGVFTGTATLNGVGGYTFVVWIDDLAEPGAQVDKFRIQFTGGNGFTYDSKDYATKEGLLDQGGNIQIHKSR